MMQTRKNFIQSVFRTLLFAAGFRTIAERFSLQHSSAEELPSGTDYNPEKHRWNMAIDIEKCIGCGRCVEACKSENNVPKEPFYFRTWIERYLIKENGDVKIDSPNGGMNGFPDSDDQDSVKGFFVPKLCNHCDKSSCVQVCPVGATYHTRDGVVLVDKEYCIGCRYCIQACPYGSRYYNPYTNTPDKCTFCYHRITKGLKPACVEACPTGARIFGDLQDKNSAVVQFEKTHKVAVLKPDLGTSPKVCYNGYDKAIR